MIIYRSNSSDIDFPPEVAVEDGGLGSFGLDSFFFEVLFLDVDVSDLLAFSILGVSIWIGLTVRQISTF